MPSILFLCQLTLSTPAITNVLGHSASWRILYFSSIYNYTLLSYTCTYQLISADDRSFLCRFHVICTAPKWPRQLLSRYRRLFMAGIAISLSSHTAANDTAIFRKQPGTWVGTDQTWFLYPWRWAELPGSHLYDLGLLIEFHLQLPW